jgi:hypothetical protein
VQDWPGGMNYEYPGIAKPFTLAARLHDNFTMTEYTYNLDIDNLEIFPSEIYKDPFVVFHGTSSFHSDNIERNGFIKSQSPFNLDEARELIRILNLTEFISVRLKILLVL